MESLDSRDYSSETKSHNKTGLRYNDRDAGVILWKISLADSIWIHSMICEKQNSFFFIESSKLDIQSILVACVCAIQNICLLLWLFITV